MDVLPIVCMQTTLRLCAHRGQKRASLEVELQMVVSRSVGAGNQTQIPRRAASALNH